MKKNQFILSATTLLFLSSCAHIKPTTKNTREYTHKKPTPTAVINDFTRDTEKIQLDKIITENKIIKKDEHFIKIKNTKKVNFWKKYYQTRGRAGFQRFIRNGERYKEIVEQIFDSYGLPKDLYYVGVIESGYQNRAKSHAGAVGPWQFMKATARRYGLKVTKSIDERKNIYKSTQAAALYFQDLYNIFGSWELALAAYNAGEYGVIRRIRGANTRDYYELSKRKILPKETRHYVPKLIAAMETIKNAHLYGFKTNENVKSRYTAAKAVKVRKSVSLKKLSRKYNVSQKIIKDLNHDILNSYIPYMGRKGFDLYIPSNKNTYLANLEEETRYSGKRKARKKRTKVKKDSRYHIVRKNESLYSISKRYNITYPTLKRLNNLKSNTIFIGQKIYLPGSIKTKTIYSYKVQKGDNLYKVANKFNSNIKEIKKLNSLNKSQIYIGQKLKVPAHQKSYYTVRSGDFLETIAKKHNVSLRRLKEINDISNNLIYPGQKLIVKMVKI